MFYPVEFIKNLQQVLRRDTESAVRDLNLNLFLVFRALISSENLSANI